VTDTPAAGAFRVLTVIADNDGVPVVAAAPAFVGG
jgi:hypothetical protein